MVPEWLATSSAPPVVRDVLHAESLDPEPLLVQQPQRRQTDVVGEVRVVAEVVDLVLAGQPPAEERQRSGQAPPPAGLGAVADRPARRSASRRPARLAGALRSYPALRGASVPATAVPPSVESGRPIAVRRSRRPAAGPSPLAHRIRRRRGARGMAVDADQPGRPPSARPSARRRGRPAARPPPTRPGTRPDRRAVGQRPNADGAGHPQLDGRGRSAGVTTGRSRAAKSSNASMVVNAGVKPARSRSRVVSITRPAASSCTWSGENPPTRTRAHHPADSGSSADRRHRQRDPAGPVDGLGQRHARRPRPTFTVPGEAHRGPGAPGSPTASCSCTNCSRASRPSDHRHRRREGEVPGQRRHARSARRSRRTGARRSGRRAGVARNPGRSPRCRSRPGPGRTTAPTRGAVSLGEDRRVPGRRRRTPRRSTGRSGCRTLSERWQAASSCMVPRTFISLAMVRAADDAGVDGRRGVHHRVHPGGLDHPGDQRVADVGPGEIGRRPSGPWRPARAARHRPR